MTYLATEDVRLVQADHAHADEVSDRSPCKGLRAFAMQVRGYSAVTE